MCERDGSVKCERGRLKESTDKFHMRENPCVTVPMSDVLQHACVSNVWFHLVVLLWKVLEISERESMSMCEDINLLGISGLYILPSICFLFILM